MEKTFPVPAGDEYGLKLSFCSRSISNEESIHACISISLWGWLVDTCILLFDCVTWLQVIASTTKFITKFGYYSYSLKILSFTWTNQPHNNFDVIQFHLISILNNVRFNTTLILILENFLRNMIAIKQNVILSLDLYLF